MRNSYRKYRILIRSRSEVPHARYLYNDRFKLDPPLLKRKVTQPASTIGCSQFACERPAKHLRTDDIASTSREGACQAVLSFARSTIFECGHRHL
jgi:hypothetical protein